MPFIDCSGTPTLQEVIQSTIACLIQGGFRVAYWAKYSDVDWDNVTHTTGEITAYTMNSGGRFYKVESNKKDATFNSEYTEDSQFYTDQINMIFDSLANKAAIQSALQVGCIVLHVFDNNCNEHVFGVEYNADLDAFEQPIKTLRVARHRIDGGQLGQSSIARNELDLIGESCGGPVSASVTEASIPITPAA